MSEHSKLQNKILKYIRAIGGVGSNVVVASRAGTHDIIACIEGRYVSIEVKVWPDKPSDLQIEHGALVLEAGGIVIYAYSLQDVINGLSLSCP